MSPFLRGALIGFRHALFLLGLVGFIGLAAWLPFAAMAAGLILIAASIGRGCEENHGAAGDSVGAASGGGG